MNVKAIIIAAVSVVVAGGAAVGTYVYFTWNDEARLAFGQKFYNALSTADYATLQENSTLGGYECIKTEDVKSLIENSDYAKYVGKNLVFKRAKYDKKTGLTTLITESKEEYQFRFINSPAGGYLWDDPEFYTDSYTVYAPTGSSISVNGVTLDETEYVEDDGVTTTYSVDRLPNIEIPISITNPYFDTINKTLNPSVDEDSANVAVSEKTLKEILESMTEQFNAMYQAISADTTIESFIKDTGRTFAEWDTDELQDFIDTAISNRKFEDPFTKYTDASCTIRQVKDTDAVFVGENTIELQLEINSVWNIGDGDEGKMTTPVTIQTTIDKDGWLLKSMSDWSWLQDLNSIRGEEQ